MATRLEPGKGQGAQVSLFVEQVAHLNVICLASEARHVFLVSEGSLMQLFRRPVEVARVLDLSSLIRAQQALVNLHVELIRPLGWHSHVEW